MPGLDARDLRIVSRQLQTGDPFPTLCFMPLDEQQEQVLTALVARLLPAEAFDDAARAKARAHLDAHAQSNPEFAAQLPTWLQWLDNETFCVFSDHFTNLHDSTRDELLDRIEADNLRTGSDALNPIEFYQSLLALVSDAIK